MAITRLSEKEQWENRWSKVKKNALEFDPDQPLFRETHRILGRFLINKNTGRFLEVGAYPGKYLWYFHKYFGYEPWGVEYVESCALQAQEMLDATNMDAKMIVDDFFNLQPKAHIEQDGWDLVASFGFVEHFEEPEIAVARHLDVTQSGGMVVISVPNHYGWNGKIMKMVDKEKWKQHNCMSLKDLINAFNVSGNNEILFSGYVGHIGFWNAGVYPKFLKLMGRWYPLIRLPLWLIEKLGQWCVPNNKVTSPEILVIAKKINKH